MLQAFNDNVPALGERLVAIINFSGSTVFATVHSMSGEGQNELNHIQYWSFKAPRLAPCSLLVDLLQCVCPECVYDQSRMAPGCLISCSILASER